MKIAKRGIFYHFVLLKSFLIMVVSNESVSAFLQYTCELFSAMQYSPYKNGNEARITPILHEPRQSSLYNRASTI